MNAAHSDRPDPEPLPTQGGSAFGWTSGKKSSLTEPCKPPICERCSGIEITVRHWGPRCARCGCDLEHEHDD